MSHAGHALEGKGEGLTLPWHKAAPAFAKLRQASGLTSTQVAERLLISQPKISHLENGRRAIKPTDVGDLCGLHRVTDPQVIDSLMQMATESDRQGWWAACGDIPYAGYIGLETAASSLHSYELVAEVSADRAVDHALRRPGAGVRLPAARLRRSHPGRLVHRARPGRRTRDGVAPRRQRPLHPARPPRRHRSARRALTAARRRGRGGEVPGAAFRGHERRQRGRGPGPRVVAGGVCTTRPRGVFLRTGSGCSGPGARSAVKPGPAGASGPTGPCSLGVA
ncbi:helix-turn-helix transcriptional regulator [Streptomyces sp. NPDC006339]|uniref:helix-turn-helix domain-containing protein n=1 Tax=Streptomyces sp. NPDC006339 TaxID=3156755 RepID=UPI00339ECAEE